MGLIDAFGKEDRVEVKFSDFYTLVLEAAKFEIARNCIKNNVPNKWAKQVFGIDEETEEEE